MIPVKEVMTRNVITFREDTTIEEIAAILSSKHITGAPVVANEGHVVGIVSETIPTTCPSLATTGAPVMRLEERVEAISSTGVSSRKVITLRVITSLTGIIYLRIVATV